MASGHQHPREADPEQAAEEKEHDRLGEQLTGETPAPGAERRAQGDFPRARGRPGQHDAGDVRAGRGQDQRDQHHQRAGETEHDVPVSARARERQRVQPARLIGRGAAVTIDRVCRWSASSAAADGERHVRPQPPAGDDAAGAVGPDREPHIARLDAGALEARRRDADDGDRPPVDPQRPADDASSPLKRRLQ